MSQHILFVCPHAAGKSLLAATYFRAAAARVGLDVVITVAGPEPDPQNMANVQQAIERQGYTIGWKPQLIDQSHTDAADVIVSVGCDPQVIPTSKPIVAWSTPMLSDDFNAAMNIIYAHAEALAGELAGR